MHINWQIPKGMKPHKADEAECTLAQRIGADWLRAPHREHEPVYDAIAKHLGHGMYALRVRRLVPNSGGQHITISVDFLR